MRKYFKLLLFELKSLIRDTMTIVLLVYPIMIILIGSFILPSILDQFGDGDVGQKMAVLIVIIIFASIAPFITSALLGFSLLDNRDENTLDTIRVTPISLRGYVIFKSIYSYILSVNASFWAIYGTKLLSGDAYTIMGENLFDQFTVGSVLIYAFVAGLFTPVFAMFVASFAKNKVEGFAYLKAAGIIVLTPVLIVLDNLQGGLQYVVGIMPLFWPVKGLLVDVSILVNDANLPSILYMLIGSIYMITLSLLMFRLFESKLES